MPQTPPFTGQLNTGGYNKNLYQSKEEGYPGLYYHDNNLVSGSLEALIHHLVPTMDYYPDVSIVLFYVPGGLFLCSLIKVSRKPFFPLLVCLSPSRNTVKCQCFCLLFSTHLFPLTSSEFMK